MFNKTINVELDKAIDYDCRKCEIKDMCKFKAEMEDLYNRIKMIGNIPDTAFIQIHCKKIGELMSRGSFFKTAASKQRIAECNESMMAAIKSFEKSNEDYYGCCSIMPTNPFKNTCKEGE